MYDANDQHERAEGKHLDSLAYLVNDFKAFLLCQSMLAASSSLWNDEPPVAQSLLVCSWDDMGPTRDLLSSEIPTMRQTLGFTMEEAAVIDTPIAGLRGWVWLGPAGPGPNNP